ncbi:uncharacterized protein LACBIDRAFT_294762 [Laccaria bicolor S238N-H82]|uniref:Predicted protein n=1 Tax=Laccaria bicolor (strain S238N-H82 / ATCC MYA-4686) TaxID=486041 RepID=B0DHU1_LACBS|nr:uncharacterized protein LACBIDRAFT_294762 [Laccaria bicolor S238N-H82]EDR05789.1 predicted protein [Laccaria bicolor S238N-H82]|eukprot:XP_001883465.1 predicted protein [Laccaria bicolor S238N-H82]
MGMKDLWKTNVRKPGDSLFTNARKGDIIVPVMGPTGVGKSSFINSYLGEKSKEKATVGHDLKSCTAELQPFFKDLPPDESGKPRRLVLVDTPGFDDTNEADSEILRRIAVWLASTYGTGTKCGGLIYLHDMTDARMRGTTLQNLHVFRKLCGKENLESVVFGTTKSGKLTPEVFARREKQLSDGYWKEFKKQGAIVFKLLDSHESARELVQKVLDRLKEEQHVLRIQEEIVDVARILPATKAGRKLKYTLEEIMEHQRRALAGKPLTPEQIEEHERKIATVASQAEELKLSLGQRLRIFFHLA